MARTGRARAVALTAAAVAVGAIVSFYVVIDRGSDKMQTDFESFVQSVVEDESPLNRALRLACPGADRDALNNAVRDLIAAEGRFSYTRGTTVNWTSPGSSGLIVVKTADGKLRMPMVQHDGHWLPCPR